MGTRIRRGRGESAGTVPLFVEVAPEVKAAIDRMAEESGAPKWAVIEAMVRHIETQMKASAGTPQWWPKSPVDQEELPLGRIA